MFEFGPSVRVAIPGHDPFITKIVRDEGYEDDTNKNVFASDKHKDERVGHVKVFIEEDNYIGWMEVDVRYITTLHGKDNK